MNHKANTSQYGFTLVELMLAMSFVSVLFMAIAMTVLHVGNTYNRGLTMKSVNQVGRDISDALRRDVAASEYTEVVLVPQTEAGAGNLNRLCLGSYTYVWNYGKAIEAGTAVKYQDSGRPIVMSRINDSGGEFCKKTGSVYPIAVSQATASEIVENDSVRLALHSFDFQTVVVDVPSNQAAYSVTFTLGTNDGAALLTNNQQCRPPDDGESNLEFCAVNKFEMIVRAGGSL